MKHVAVMFFVIIGLLLPMSDVNGLEYDIPYQGQRIGSVTINYSPDPSDSSRVIISALARFGSFTQTLDRILGSQGNFLGRCSRRLSWAGNTSVRDTGATLGLSSRVRYEQWVCGAIKTRLVRDTKTVLWRASVMADQIENIRIAARVENIPNFPDYFEERLGLRVTETIRIPIPVRCGKCRCSELVSNLNPLFKGARFSMDGRTLVLKVDFSIKNDLGEVLRCFG